MKLAPRASRPGLTVRSLRILCKGLCRRFHAEGQEQMCKVECPDEPDSLLHYNECPLLYNFFASVRRRAIVIMGVIDAFVYAHNHHRRNMDNPGNFGDCIKGRVRFMTAVTPAYAHAYQLICLTRYVPVVHFCVVASKARHPHLPNAPTTTRDKGNNFQRWAIYTDGCTRLVDGEISAGWSAIARSHHGSIDVMFGPGITTEAGLAHEGARVHSKRHR